MAILEHDDHVERTTEEARQGETSGHVRIILASSLALAVLVWIVISYVPF